MCLRVFSRAVTVLRIISTCNTAEQHTTTEDVGFVVLFSSAAQLTARYDITYNMKATDTRLNREDIPACFPAGKFGIG